MGWETYMALSFGACLAGIVWLIRRAPEGYEDDTGFHYGREELDEVAQPKITTPEEQAEGEDAA